MRLAMWLLLVMSSLALASCQTVSLGGASATAASVDKGDYGIEQAQARFVAAGPSSDPSVLEALSVAPEPEAEDDLSEVGLEIHVFDIGQADSMLVVGPEPARRTLLIDLGEPRGERNRFRHVGRRLETILDKKELDYFVVSHFHADHVGSNGSGIDGLIDRLGFRIGTVIDIGAMGSTFFPAGSRRRTYNRFVANVEQWLAACRVQTRIRPKAGSGQIDLGPDVVVEVLAFGGRTGADDPGALTNLARRFPGIYDTPPSENDLSIALEISYGEFELFTAGDLTGAENPKHWYTRREFDNGGVQIYTNVERHLVNHWLQLGQEGRESDVEIYRVNHHGSGHSTTPWLLRALDPEFMIYSTGGMFKHPDRRVVKAGNRTAWQYVTDRVSTTTRRAWFEARKGTVTGEVVIRVFRGGGWYSIEGELHKAYTDLEEQGLPLNNVVRRGPRGDDVSEELNLWIWDQD